MSKLIIQICCYNEEEQLAATIADLPRQVLGADEVEILVVDDGSTDRTSEIARQAGVDYILRLPVNQGLARAFACGLDAAVKLGADIIVNTDADNQYRGEDIARLIAPIVEGQAQMVVADRRPLQIGHFGLVKRFLQHYGSWVVRQLSGTQVPDAASGFRAFSREAALKINVFSNFTYTLETIIQAGKKQIPIAHVTVETNAPRRSSRLFVSLRSYLRRSINTLLRIYALYEPLKVFASVGGALVLAGALLGVRFLYYYAVGQGGGHIQSLILSAILIIVGFQTLTLGLVADLIGSSRSLVEDILFRLRKLEVRMGEEAEVTRRDSERPAPPGRRVRGGPP